MTQAQRNTQDELRLTTAALRQAAGSLVDAVFEGADRGELEVVRHVCERILAARGARRGEGEVAA